MLDLRFIRENSDAVKANVEARHVEADVERVLELYDRRNEAIQEIEALRKRRNENAAAMKSKLSDQERERLISEGKELKGLLPQLEERLGQIEEELNREARRIPNMTHPDAPRGADEESNREVARFGEPRQFDFDAKDHVELGQELDIIDFETGTKVSGTKFYYLKNRGALLELALSRYAMDILEAHGFVLTITPDIARTEIVEGIGFNPRGGESNIYTLEGEESCLVGTAEITLGGYYARETLPGEKLPLKMAGLSHCFRREAGAAGQFSKGLYRVHQFTKVEMFVYTRPEESEAMLEELRGIEEEIFRGLEIPFRVVDTATGDLGGPAYRKYDLEAWMPGRGESGGWGEITSTSNCTDYQARRLGVRFVEESGEGGKRREFVHMLNGTAIAVSRAIIALLENFQQADGSVRIPEKLVPYCGFEVIEKR
ncbi:MAG: serine--tRNA ligase [Alkalispirochaetaceae bacterium]